MMLLGLCARLHAQTPPEPTLHFADAADAPTVLAGKAVYTRYCGSCHGKRLQGQPLWQIEDPYSARRAPAHDESGHTWQHSDEEIFHKTKFGRFSFQSSGSVPYMPAFEGTLSDTEILGVIAFIKARWPLAIRVSQAMLNPGFAGMPPDAGNVEWTLPPNCRTTAARWRSESR